MKQAKTRKPRGKIEVTLVRPAEEDVTISMSKGATVEEALSELDFDVPAGQALYVGDTSAEYDSVLEDGDILQVVGKKEGGKAEEKEEGKEEESNESNDESEDDDEDEEDNE